MASGLAGAGAIGVAYILPARRREKECTDDVRGQQGGGSAPFSLPFGGSVTQAMADAPVSDLGPHMLRRKTKSSVRGLVESSCRPLIVCGPSGVGKSTLIRRLMREFPEDFGFSVSHTTRGPRSGEKDGVDYHFTNNEDMLSMIKRGEFLEHAHVHNRIYGTSINAVADVTNNNRICILDIDVQVGQVY